MRLIGMIADHPTPKQSVNIDSGCYTLNSRGYKGVMVVVYECDDDRTKRYGRKVHD